MAFRILAVLASLLSVNAASAVAQAGASDDVIALHREIFGRPVPLYDEFAAAVFAQLTLARAYEAGSGVARDVEFACGLAQVAADLASGINEDKRLAARALNTRDELCASVPDRKGAFDRASCPLFGIEPQLIDLGNGSRLNVTRLRWSIEDLTGIHEGDWGLNCNDTVVSMRHVRIDPPPDSRGSVRQFLEFFLWSQSFFQDGTPIRTLGWQLFEFDSTRSELLPSSGYQILESKGSIWPAPPVPEEFSDGPTFRMLPSGAVRWQFERDRRPASGLIDADGSFK